MCASELRIRLFGGLDLTYDGARLQPLESTRAISLLAYLLLNGDAPQRRERVAFMLWPDSSEAQARTNLRHVLHTLRRALPDADLFLHITQHTIQWRHDAPACVDVSAFEQALAAAQYGSDESKIVSMQNAIEFYSGELLEGYYDEWLVPERDRLRRRYIETLGQLAALFEAQGQYAAAIEVTERLLRHDQVNETAYCTLMRLHDAVGNRAHALQVYHVCTATLERELGVAPSATTQAEYMALLPVSDPVVNAATPSESTGPPFVGRLIERRRLTAIRQSIEKDGPHFVLVTGEAGIGKTRLVEDFLLQCTRHGATTASARAFQAEGALTYGPLISWLRSTAVQGSLRRLDGPYLKELSRLLPELRSGPPDVPYADPISERDRRQNLFDATARALQSVQGPLLLFADDLQWFDRETLQFLHYLLRVDSTGPLLVVATARTGEIDYQHPLNDLRAGLLSLGRLTEIELKPLTREETGALAERISGHTFAERDVAELHRETEGNALFVIEAVRAGWESIHQRGGWTSPRVQTVIETRLAQLSVPAQELIGVAATIGREFNADVLAHASGVDEETLVLALDELWRRRLIRDQGALAYDFSHEKIREVAYLALSPAMRQHHHLRLARTLAHLYADRFDSVSGQIAAHFEQAGRTIEAIEWHMRAAEAAQRVYAAAEAIRLLDHAAGLLRSMPASDERDARELEILSSLPSPLLAHDAYASDRLNEIHARARELSGALGVALAPPLLRSMAVASLTRGDFETARLVGVQLSTQAENERNDVLLVEAMYVLGIAAFWEGELLDARGYFERAADRYRSEDRQIHILRYGQDPKVVCLSRLANTLWFLGQTEAATRARDAALDFSQETGHPLSRSIALFFAALLALDMGEIARLREHLAALELASSDIDARQFRLVRGLLHCYLDARDRHDMSGMMRIMETLERPNLIEVAPGNISVVVRALLEACKVAGDARTGLSAADRALREGTAGAWEAEARRLRGEFLAELGGPDQQIEADFLSALKTSRRQSAKILELRATMSLLRHRLRVGSPPAVRETRDSLAVLVDELSQFGVNQDLLEAQSLLTSL